MSNECKWYSRSSSISQAFPSYDSKCAEVCQGTQLLKIRTLDMVEKWQTWNPTTWGTNKEKQKPQTFNPSSLLSDPGPALNRAKWLQDDTTDSNTSRVFNSPRDASRPFAVVHNFWLNILCSIMQLSRRCVGFSSARWPLNDGQPGLRVCSFVWTKGFQMDRNQRNREKKNPQHCHSHTGTLPPLGHGIDNGILLGIRGVFQRMCLQKEAEWFSHSPMDRGWN